MSFQFDLIANTQYHLKFSIIDPRNAENNGFLASTAISNILITYQPYNASSPNTVYYAESDQFPTLFSLPSGAVTGPFRGIKAGTVEYGHACANQLNVVNLKLSFNRSDITGLVFEIPLVDLAGTALYSNSAFLTAFFGL
jgi:hypothetical protein